MGVDLVPERLDAAADAGAMAIDVRAVDDVAAVVRDLTDGRGADAVLEAVGMEAHGNPIVERVIKGAQSRSAVCTARWPIRCR